MKITRDGFVWKLITAEEARKIWDAEIFEIYKLYDDDSEGLIESEERLLEEIAAAGSQLAIEVGKIDSVEFVRDRIPSVKWVDSEAMEDFSSAFLGWFSLAIERRDRVFNLFLNGAHVGGFPTMETANGSKLV